MDESVSNGVTVFAGYVSTVDRWARFRDEWREILPLSRRSASGVYRFKMEEMKADLQDIAPFMRVINENTLFSLVVVIDSKIIHRASRRLWTPTIDRKLPFFDKPWLVGFTFLFNSLSSVIFDDAVRVEDEGDLRAEMRAIVKANGPIEFIFDQHTAKEKAAEIWREVMEVRGEAEASLYARNPGFTIDDISPPLQAADCLAWLSRDSYIKGQLRDPEPFLRGKGPEEAPPRLVLILNEEGALDWMVQQTTILYGDDVDMFTRSDPLPDDVPMQRWN